MSHPRKSVLFPSAPSPPSAPRTKPVTFGDAYPIKIEFARLLLARGWKIAPTIGKTPTRREAFADLDDVRRHCKQGLEHNVAIVLPDDVIMLDFDSPGAALTCNMRTITPKGAHAFFVCPAKKMMQGHPFRRASTTWSNARFDRHMPGSFALLSGSVVNGVMYSAAGSFWENGEGLGPLPATLFRELCVGGDRLWEEFCVAQAAGHRPPDPRVPLSKLDRSTPTGGIEIRNLVGPDHVPQDSDDIAATPLYGKPPDAIGEHAPDGSFFVVLSDDHEIDLSGGYNFARMPTAEDAQRAADQMAGRFPGKTFRVLSLVSSVTASLKRA